VLKRKRNSHCSFCGQRWGDGEPWPRTCAGCGETSYVNPLPVAVVLVPMDGGLLVVRRGIEPSRGKLALPGGYVNLGETWQEAGAREVLEETGIRVDAASIEDFWTRSGSDGTLLVFGVASAMDARQIEGFSPTAETTELAIIRGPDDLAFPLHTDAARVFFARRRADGRSASER
jgi:ADP-ribose pyrophosphatase YjhB (NUDIX family)